MLSPDNADLAKLSISSTPVPEVQPGGIDRRLRGSKE